VGKTFAPPYTVSGVVRDQQSQPVPEVTITMSGAGSGQQTTLSGGTYSFSGLDMGSYTFTPSAAGYVFDPSSITYPDLQGSKTNADFTALTIEQTLYNKTVNYDYNAVGALAGVGTNLIGSDPNATTNVLNTVSFRGSGALKTLHYGNGRRLRMNYWELRSQPKGMTVDRASNPSDKIIDYLYEYNDASGNNNNRIRKITDNVDTSYTTTYLYDDYDRLTHATSPASSGCFLYDEWGNLKNLSGLQINHATNASGAPATNRISTAVSGSTTLTHSYDAAGNMTNDGTKTMDYDGANRLKAVNGGSSTYGYDGNGMRARVTDGGSAVFYVHSMALGQNAIEVTSAGVHRTYVHVGGKMVAMQATDGQFYWSHSNHLGSSRAMTDVNGNLAYRGQFAPFGGAISEWSSSGNTNLNKKKFTGYERDEATGLDYANARMHNSARGRFTQPDRLGLGAANVRKPQTLNRYTYTSNDPINFIDPTGLDDIPFIGHPLTIYTSAPFVNSGGGVGGGGTFAPLLGNGTGDEAGGQGGGGGMEQLPILANLSTALMSRLGEAFNLLIQRIKFPTENCFKNVIEPLSIHPGFDMGKFLEYLGRGFNAYDGAGSTVPAVGTLGTIDQVPESYIGKSVQQLFGGATRYAITAVMPGTEILTVFFNPASIQFSPGSEL
jgi:RHS repeat-associated protein